MSNKTGDHTLQPIGQPALFDELDDSAILFPAEELRKRYTADQAMELERLAEAVVMLLPLWPIEAIAKRLHLSSRTVRALAARESEKVAGTSKEAAEILMRTAMRFVALARTREHEANFKDLMVGASLAVQNATQLAAMSQGVEEKEVKEERDLVEAAAALRAMMDRQRAEDQASIDTVSTVSTVNAGQSEGSGSVGAGEGANQVQSEGQQGTGQSEGEGGGLEVRAPGSGPMGPSDREIFEKGAPLALIADENAPPAPPPAS